MKLFACAFLYFNKGFKMINRYKLNLKGDYMYTGLDTHLHCIDDQGETVKKLDVYFHIRGDKDSVADVTPTINLVAACVLDVVEVIRKEGAGNDNK